MRWSLWSQFQGRPRLDCQGTSHPERNGSLPFFVPCLTRSREVDSSVTSDRSTIYQGHKERMRSDKQTGSLEINKETCNERMLVALALGQKNERGRRIDSKGYICEDDFSRQHKNTPSAL